MSFRPTNRSLETSVRMSLDTWAFRSESKSPIDIMILTKSASECDTELKGQSKSSLMCLPLELLALIGELCSPVDAVCFTLTCKRAACAVGIKSWSLFPKVGFAQNDRWILLHTLKRDLPDYHLCFYLGKLVKLSNEPPYRADTKYLPKGCPRRTRAIDTPGRRRPYLLSFCDIHLIVERQKYGPSFGLSLEDFKISTPWSQPNAFTDAQRGAEPYLWKLDIDLLFDGKELFLHSTERYLVPRKGTVSIHELLPNGCAFGRLTCPYRHPRDMHSQTHDINTAIIEQSQYSHQSEVKKCAGCATETYFAGFNHKDHNAVELVVDVYQNLGQGQRPQGPGWQELMMSHLGTAYASSLSYKPARSKFPDEDRVPPLFAVDLKQDLHLAFGSEVKIKSAVDDAILAQARAMAKAERKDIRRSSPKSGGANERSGLFERMLTYAWKRHPGV